MKPSYSLTAGMLGSDRGLAHTVRFEHAHQQFDWKDSIGIRGHFTAVQCSQVPHPTIHPRTIDGLNTNYFRASKWSINTRHTLNQWRLENSHSP